MDRLKEILMEAYATIKANQDSSHEAVDPVLVEAMQKYATVVAEDALKRAAENVPLGVISDNRKDEARQSILSTEINLDL